MSITSRILLGVALISVVSFYLLLDPILDRVERQYLEAAEVPMVDTAHILAEFAAPVLTSAEPDFEPMTGPFEAVLDRRFKARIYNHTKTGVEFDLYITDANGIVLFDSRTPSDVGADYRARLDVAETLQGNYGARSSRDNEEDPESSVMYVAAPIFDREGNRIGVATVSQPQKVMFGFIEETRGTLLRLGLWTTAAALLSGFLLSRWVAAPIRRLTDYAAAVAQGAHPSLPHLPGRQLKVLGRSMESMRAALDGRQYVENYVQTLTHEMKSPVAGIRGAAELLEEAMPEEQRRKFLANIRTETGRLERLSDRLLALSSVESRNQLERREPIALATLIDRIGEEQRSFLETQETSLDKQLAPGLIVQGDPFLLGMAISNLLQNAIEFSPAGGTVRITAERRSDKCRITIEDEGPGIPDYARERIFERFYSLPRPRTGKRSSGLGLCFVAEAIELHGGSVRLESREPQGAAAILELPTG